LFPLEKVTSGVAHVRNVSLISNPDLLSHSYTSCLVQVVIDPNIEFKLAPDLPNYSCLTNVTLTFHCQTLISLYDTCCHSWPFKPQS